MQRRFFLLIALVAALGLGVAVASSAAGQKDKQKDQDKNKASRDSGVDGTHVFALPAFGGDGSYLGVFLEEVSAERMKELNLSEERGAVVMKVVEGSPAEKAGLKENDVIVSFNGRRVDSMRELQRLLSETPADRKVSVEVIRGGNHQTLSATLSKRSNNFNMVMPEWNGTLPWFSEKDGIKAFPHNFGNFTLMTPGSQTFRGTRLGITGEALTDQLAEYFGIKDGRGVLITEVNPNSAAAKAGLKAGDVIIAINDEKINDVTALVTALTSKGEGPVTVKIMRNQSEQTVTVTLEKRSALPAPRRRASVAATASTGV